MDNDCPHCRCGCWHCVYKERTQKNTPPYKLERREDGSIPERQDRAGYSKHWTYETQGVYPDTSVWEAWHVGIDRLDQAIQETLDIPDHIIHRRIIQTTVTIVWDSEADSIRPIGTFEDDIDMFKHLT